MKRLLSLLLLAAVTPVALAACSPAAPQPEAASPDTTSTPFRPSASPGTGQDGPGEGGVDSPQKPETFAPATCPVTIPTIFLPTGGYTGDALFGAATSHGNGQLYVGGLGENGVLTPMSAGTTPGTRGTKLGWLRIAPGKLTITGRRLDTPAAALTSSVPDGYGDKGFQSTGVSFPSGGCWEITGTLNAGTPTPVTLTFTTFVTG